MILGIQRNNPYPKSVQPGVPNPSSTPNGWRKLPLRNYLREIRRPAKLKDNETYKLVTVKRSRGGVEERGWLTGKEIKTKTQFYVAEGDFLVSKRQIVHGACAIVPKELEGAVISNEYCILHGNEAIDIEFLKHLSYSVYFQQTCFHSSIGVHVEKMIFRVEKWLNWEFNIPPIDEQYRIAHALNTWDKAISQLTQLINAKRQLKKSLMQQLLTGKQRLPGFTGEWKKTRLGDVADMNSGGTPKSSVEDYYKGNIPWVSIADMTKQGKYISTTKKHITELGLRNSTAQIYPENTVLYAMYASIGECSIAKVRMCSSQAILGIRPKDFLCFNFLYYYLFLLKDAIKLQGQQGTQSNLNAGMVKEFKLNLPPLEEQTHIAAILSASDTEISELEQKLDAYREQKKGLMQQLLTGKKRVKLDPVGGL